MPFDIGTRVLSFARPLLDIAPPRTPTAVQSSGLADVAAAPGLEMALVGTIAAGVAAVLVFILRSRRR